MTPYRIRSRSVSVRRRRGPEFVVVSLPKPLSLLLRNYSRKSNGNPRLFAKPRTSPPVRHPARPLYSIVSIRAVCATFLFRAIPNLPHFSCHFLSCTLGQVAKSSGGVLYFTHGMILP